MPSRAFSLGVTCLYRLTRSHLRQNLGILSATYWITELKASVCTCTLSASVVGGEEQYSHRQNMVELAGLDQD